MSLVVRIAPSLGDPVDDGSSTTLLGSNSPFETPTATRALRNTSPMAITALNVVPEM
jgi:hypothetical protein